MTGSPQYASQRGIVCCICAGPIPLETSNTDERGKAVHEECYVRKTIFSRFRTASAVHLPENWLSSIVVRFQLRLRWTLFPAKQRNGNSAGLHPELPAMSPELLEYEIRQEIIHEICEQLAPLPRHDA
jgi:hypothetical protein